MNNFIRYLSGSWTSCTLGWSMKTPKYEIQKVYPFIRCVWAVWLWFFWNLDHFWTPPNPLEVYVVNLLHSKPDFSSCWKCYLRNVSWSNWIFHQSLPIPLGGHSWKFRSFRQKMDPPGPFKGLCSKRYIAAIDVLPRSINNFLQYLASWLKLMLLLA